MATTIPYSVRFHMSSYQFNTRKFPNWYYMSHENAVQHDRLRLCLNPRSGRPYHFTFLGGPQHLAARGTIAQRFRLLCPLRTGLTSTQPDRKFAFNLAIQMVMHVMGTAGSSSTGTHPNRSPSLIPAILLSLPPSPFPLTLTHANRPHNEVMP
jgi:hypothetical protein